MSRLVRMPRFKTRATRLRTLAVFALLGASASVPGTLLAGSAPARAAAATTPCGPWMNPDQSPDTRAQELVSAMSLAQKIQMVHQYLADGVYYGAAGYIPPIPALCVPPLMLNDAGTGLADEQIGVTSYPAGISQASSWDPNLEQQLGASLGSEAHQKGVNVLLGPDVNIARVPLNGRTSEAFGEDPYLVGQTAAAFVDGVQSQHVIATVKHYDANNQETNRETIDEKIDDRTEHEIYQAPFDTAVNQAHAGAVMCAYNQVNGAYSCQNPTILSTDLDGQYAFPGFVMSDWGATHSTVQSALAGLDMEMDVVQTPDALSTVIPNNPGSEDYYNGPLQAAVEDGQVPMSTLNDMVERILRSMFAIGLFDDPAASEPQAWATDVDTPANQQVALDAAEEGTVLLKNAGAVLPLGGSDKTIALIGQGAGAGAALYTQAGGSVHVNQPDVVTPLAAITQRAAQSGDAVVYNDGTNVQAAAALAKTADMAIVYAGYVESEGVDLTNLDYDEGVCDLTCVTTPSNADQLIAAVAAANPHTVVVLNTGGPSVMPWLGQVSAVVEAWYPGEQDGNAAAAILFGDVDPSGKLPITFPVSLSQIPTQTAEQYPGVNGTAVYSEGLLVGYRWYEAKGITPLFPFGFGLSYTSFKFSGLSATTNSSGIAVHLTVENTGSRSGADVAQVYVSDPASVGEPPQSLAGYQKVTLGPGQKKSVTIDIANRAFSYWNTSKQAWQTSPGCYTLRVGDSSANLPLTTKVARAGGTC